jgi:hypothetical protein
MAAAAAHDQGVERLAAAIQAAVDQEGNPVARISAGLTAALGLLAGEPSLAQLLLVASLATTPSARREHERSLARLANTLHKAHFNLPGDEAVSEESARMLAGGVVSHLSGRAFAGETQRLADSHDLLLRYLLVPSYRPATGSVEPCVTCG